MFPDQNSFVEKHALCTSRPIPMHTACACPVHLLCVIALHPRRCRTPKIFRLMTQTTILALQSVGLGIKEAMTFSFFGGGRQLSPKVIRKP